MVVSVFLYPVLYGLELFLASALITQIAVSLAAAVVSTVTIYFCRQQLVHWHQERVLKKRRRWQSDVSIKTSKKQRRGDNSDSSEGELSDPSLLRRLRAGLRSRSHEHIKTRASRDSGEKRIPKSPSRPSEEAKKDTQDSGRVRPKLTKPVGAMHRSHWVAKPQQSQPTVRRRSSESDAELRAGSSSPTAIAAGTVPERLVQEEPSISVSTQVMVGQTEGMTLKRSRATAKMTLKKHPRFSSSDSSSSVSPASSSESDDLVHGESGERTESHADVTVSTRRVPSIQVEPIVEERIIPIGFHVSSHPPSSKMEKSTKKEISRLEFSLGEAGSHSNQQHQALEGASQTAATDDVDVPQSSAGTAAVDTKQVKDEPGISNVPSISTSEVPERLTMDEPITAEQTDSQQNRRDSLGVPPVITGEEAYPEGAPPSTDDYQSAFVWVSELAVASSERPLILEPGKGVSMTVEADDFVAHSSLAENQSALMSSQISALPFLPPNDGDKMDKRMHSLDVPPIITGEVCFPSTMLTGSDGQRVEEDQTNNGQTASARKIIKIRPKSLDIPPIMPAPYSRNSQSAPPSPPSSPGHGVKRKHSSAKSILKRSGSMERPGRKKSVSFSPEVSPREFEVERCHDVDRERLNAPKRPRVFRHFSMDIPDARLASEEDISLSTPHQAWSHGDLDDNDSPPVFSPAALDTSDNLSRAEGWVHPSPLEPMQIEGSDARMAFVPISALVSDEGGRKSAKERFLEAGGAKAVLSVLCTQDSSDSNGSKYTSTSAAEASNDATTNDGSEEDSMETMPDIDQPLSLSGDAETDPLNDDSVVLLEDLAAKDQQDSKGIKSRFLEYKEDSADIHTSRLFVQTVRSSIESDSSDEQDRSPVQPQEAKPDVKHEATCEEAGDQTSAKSRFLQSCQEVNDDGEVQNGSRFVVSVVRPYNTGCHRQDSPPHDGGEIKEPADPRQVWNREVPDGSNANTWRNLLEHELSEDIEFYEAKKKSSRDTKRETVLEPGELPVQYSRDSPPDTSPESDIDSPPTRSQSCHQSDSYSVGASVLYSPVYSDNAAVVIDNGSEMLKVGFGGDCEPRFTIPSVVGRYPRDGVSDSDDTGRTAYIGHEATRLAGVLSADFPSSEGVIHDWEDLEQIWDHVYTSLLNVAPQEHAVLISEYASTAKKQREKCVQILFERFQVPSLCLVNQGALALHAQGNTSGMVLSSGGGLTEVVPVLDGCTMHSAVTTLKFAGSQVTHHLGCLLQSDSSFNMTSPSKLEILRDIKETMAYVCMDYEREMQRVRPLDPIEYKLPDGSSLAVMRKDLFQCTEQLFRPDLGGLEQRSGIHDMIQETLKRCDPNVLPGIRKSLLLAGGNTQLRGFGDRLQLELASAHLPWSVSMPQERTNSVWIGGSLVATHDNFTRRCVTAAEYTEHGPAVMHPKCF
ncbi:uncharacterized protein LOC119743373 [Patiria miniata]|uniref:Actin n=1 Tax=Patiria miniata TaxID=46514 RepID=A0A914BIG2_PATMI|nr:uncharacterized protein LOC119743373 [Patiria miniata]